MKIGVKLATTGVSLPLVCVAWCPVPIVVLTEKSNADRLKSEALSCHIMSTLVSGPRADMSDIILSIFI